MNSKEVFFNFLKEYAEFFVNMVLLENEKLDALLSNKLNKIEQSISDQQAMAKQLNNMEKKRMRLQADAGFGTMSFNEIIDACPDIGEKKLRPLFNKIQTAISDVKFLNDKSMKIVNDNMQAVNSKLQGQEAEVTNYGYSKEQTTIKPQGSSLLETKV